MQALEGGDLWQRGLQIPAHSYSEGVCNTTSCLVLNTVTPSEVTDETSCDTEKLKSLQRNNMQIEAVECWIKV